MIYVLILFGSAEELLMQILPKFCQYYFSVTESGLCFFPEERFFFPWEETASVNRKIQNVI